MKDDRHIRHSLACENDRVGDGETIPLVGMGALRGSRFVAMLPVVTIHPWTDRRT